MKRFFIEKKALCLYLLVLSIAIVLFYASVGVYMDDVFIYLRMARNIASGVGPVINPGDSHFAVTSPLWVFLLALFHKVLPFISLVTLAKILFTVFLALASLFLFLTLKPRIACWAALAPLPIFFNKISVSTAGGEIALVYLALFGLVWAQKIKTNFLLLGLFAAIGYLARGEFILIWLPIAVFHAWTAVKKKKKLRQAIVEMLPAFAVFLLLIALWHAYYAWQFHSLFPNTLKTKTIQGQSGKFLLYYNQCRPHILEIINGRYYLLFFLFFGLFYFYDLSLFLVGFSLLHYYAYKFLVVPDYHWYFYDLDLLLAFFIFFGLIGFCLFLKNKLNIFRKKMALAAGIFIVIAGTTIVAASLTQLFQLNRYRGDHRLPVYQRVSRWLNAHLHKNEVVLAYEIGIIGYLVPQCIIRDLSGLASPDTTAENLNDLIFFVGRYHPDYIVSFAWSDWTQEYYLLDNEINAYPVAFKAKFNDRYYGEFRTTVFAKSKPVTFPPETAGLVALLQNRSRSIEPRLILLNGRQMLFAHAPFVSSIAIPQEAKGVALNFGFIPAWRNLKDIHCDGVTFQIYGESVSGQSRLYSKLVNPCQTPKIRLRQRAQIFFTAGQFKLLKVAIAPNRNSDYDWTYIDRLTFFF